MVVSRLHERAGLRRETVLDSASELPSQQNEPVTCEVKDGAAGYAGYCEPLPAEDVLVECDRFLVSLECGEGLLLIGQQPQRHNHRPVCGQDGKFF